LWVCLTKDYLNDLIFEFEIDEAIQKCFDAAEEVGYPLDTIFVAGHSMGGAFVDSYIQDNLRPNYAGVLLFGSWPASDTNDYPIPLLTSVGTLDGGGVSAAVVEWRQTKANPNAQPVLMIEEVNHVQVAAGVYDDPELNADVISRDIDPVVSEAEAHERYATAAVSHMVTAPTTVGQFGQDVVSEQTAVFADLSAYTEAFVEPFNQLLLMEEDEDGDQSPWLDKAQRILLHADDDSIDLSELTVLDNLVPFDILGGTKPEIFGGEECLNVTVSTFNSNKYDFSLTSAATMKAKLKLPDEVLGALCQNEVPRRKCQDINLAALQLALSKTEPGTLERYYLVGRQLVIGDDIVAATGPDWLEGPGLQFNSIETSPETIEVVAVSLPTESGPTDFNGMEYCDLLSPYRALEFIYIQSVLNGNPFE